MLPESAQPPNAHPTVIVIDHNISRTVEKVIAQTGSAEMNSTAVEDVLSRNENGQFSYRFRCHTQTLSSRTWCVEPTVAVFFPYPSRVGVILGLVGTSIRIFQLIRIKLSISDNKNLATVLISMRT